MLNAAGSCVSWMQVQENRMVTVLLLCPVVQIIYFVKSDSNNQSVTNFTSINKQQDLCILIVLHLELYSRLHVNWLVQNRVKTV